MKRDPRKHIVIDASALAAYLAPKTCKNQDAINRVCTVIDSVVTHEWPSLRLYVPSVCLTETQCVLDKYRYCTWHGPARDQQYRLTKKEYTEASRDLIQLVDQRQLEIIHHETNHILAARLISIVNSKYQVRRQSKKTTKKANRRRIKPPMGSSDCLIAGMAIELGHRLGNDSVVLMTLDKRLTDVVTKCKQVPLSVAKNLGLVDSATELGLKWSKEIYPSCLNLNTATDEELGLHLQGWPLPSRDVTKKNISGLTHRERKHLYDIGQEIKIETGIAPDSLPYTHALDVLQTRFAVKTGIFMTKAEIQKLLLRWRKNPASRPQ